LLRRYLHGPGAPRFICDLATGLIAASIGGGNIELRKTKCRTQGIRDKPIGIELKKLAESAVSFLANAVGVQTKLLMGIGMISL
jgi:hypothetical protein